MLKVIFIFFVILAESQNLMAQKNSVGEFKGINIEFNTLVLINNLKIAAEFEYYKNDFLIVALQPGFEFIHAFSASHVAYYNSPFYDINLLGSFHLIYYSDISIKPFIGLAYRITSSKTSRESYFEPKYGLTIQFNIIERFNICVKAMKVSIRNKDELPFLVGIGFNVILF